MMTSGLGRLRPDAGNGVAVEQAELSVGEVGDLIAVAGEPTGLCVGVGDDLGGLVRQDDRLLLKRTELHEAATPPVG